MEKNTIFRIEAQCDDRAAELMNLHLSITSFDGQGQQLATDYTDIAPIREGETYGVQTSAPAASVAVSLYAVPAGNPSSDLVADTPPFSLSFRVLRGNDELDRREIRVNRWGGTQLIGLTYK